MSPDAVRARDEANRALDSYKLALARYATATGDWSELANLGTRMVWCGATIIAEAASFGEAAERTYRVADEIVGLSDGNATAALPRGTIIRETGR